MWALLTELTLPFFVVKCIGHKTKPGTKFKPLTADWQLLSNQELDYSFLANQNLRFQQPYAAFCWYSAVVFKPWTNADIQTETQLNESVAK